MYRHHPNPNTDFIEKNHSDSESDNEHNHTLDQELKQKKGITIFRPNKPTTSKAPLVAAATNARKSKSILKVSRTFDKSSFDDIIQSKNQFFQDRGHPQMEHSEISEIEKIESVINRSDDQIREVSPREERSPSFKPPSKTGGFGAMARFSQQKEQDSIDMMSSQTSGYDRVVERKDTEDIKSNPENRSSKGSPPSMPGIDSADAVRSQQQSERGGYTETPGFKRDKVVKTTESGSNNPTSMSAIHADDFLPPPPLLVHNRDSRHSNSDLAEIFAKKISESSISRKHIKRATFVSSDPKNNHIIPAYTHYVLDENLNQQQVYMPHLADREITDAFATLDMNKDGYITADEIAYFLEVLEENATEAEIEEMIRMVDYEGTGRVRYEEFYKLATGKNLNPIGQAYPPTLDLFEKKNGIGLDIRRTKKIDGLESSPVNRNFRPLVSRDTPAPLEIHTYSRGQGKIDSKLSKLPRLGDLGDEETKHIKTDKDERDSYFKGFIRQAGLNSKTYMERYHKVEFSNDQRVSKATYKDFLSFFAIDDQDVTKKVFSIISKDRNHLDMRQVMIALSLYLDFTVDEKIGLAYNLYDPDGRDGYILYNELMKIFKMFQLGEEHKKIERKIKTSLNWEWKSIMPEDSIPKEDFIMICKNYPDLFPSNS